jgi:hypothetical protein
MITSLELVMAFAAAAKNTHVVLHRFCGGGGHRINCGTCSDNIVLHIVHGGCVGSVTVHVSLVGSGQVGQMVLDQCQSETRDGGELFNVVKSAMRNVADGREHRHWWM